MGRYRYYLALQTLLPDRYREDKDFIQRMKVLQSFGFDGVELNIRNPDALDPKDLRSFLEDFDLELSMFATGFTAKTEGLSLASTDEKKRSVSVQRAKDFLAFARQFGAGIIAGFLKGASGETSDAHREALKRSIEEVSEEAAKLQTPFLVEAINRFESPIGNSLDDTWSLVKGANRGYTYILPDTWHMNIEEANMEAAIVTHRGHFISFHLSENNRYFPGHGALDFKHIIGILDACGYKGKLAIEGNLKKGFAEDVGVAMEILAPLLRPKD
ncbi:MAG: sugar phosphate isomerase/epimerase [Spirochaetes bacterium]|nr:sugar phosphate isomerase/epimerase [Spirochaetota bacterium]